MPVQPEDELFAGARKLLEDATADVGQLRAMLSALLVRGQAQERLLERVTRLSDGYQRAERDRGDGYLRHYERELKRIEKIVRISDRYQLMLQEANHRLGQMAKTDQLTGLPNRHHAVEVIESQINLVNRQSARFCLAILDIDYFKSINDRFGHAAGDSALSSVAGALRKSARDYDFCARWGGEEFLVLLPFTGAAEAMPVLERIRKAIGELQFSVDAQGARLTASVGFALYHPGELSHQCLQRADLALYRAKREGRNCIRGEADPVDTLSPDRCTSFEAGGKLRSGAQPT